MPLYEYQCPQCGRFEVIRKFSDEALKACPTCGREVQKLLSSPAIQFKGSGWYITDYARKGGSAGSDGAGKKDGKAGDAASASTPAASGSDSSTSPAKGGSSGSESK